jgi:hypothetical protein
MADADELYANLHPITRQEADAYKVFGEDFYPFVAALTAREGAKTCVIDGKVAFIAASRPGPRGRRTSFLMAKSNGRKLAIAARQWAKEERMAFPHTKFEVCSYSLHPLRDRFFAALGLAPKVQREGFALFEG